MKVHRRAPGYVPNPDYTQEDWDEVSDNPELTDEELAAMRPAREVLPPEVFQALAARKRGRPPASTTKTLLSLRLDPRVIDHFRATGPGWQGRINAVLVKAAGLE